MKEEDAAKDMAGRKTGVGAFRNEFIPDNTSVDEEDEEGAARLTLQEMYDAAKQTGRDAAAAGMQTRPGRKKKPKTDTDFEYNMIHSHVMHARLIDERRGWMTFNDAKTLYNFLTEQMSAKAGLKRFGEAGAQAVMKELEQLLYRKVMHGRKSHELTQAEKRGALQYLMFLIQKRCGKIKGRGCADGRNKGYTKQRKRRAHPQ